MKTRLQKKISYICRLTVQLIVIFCKYNVSPKDILLYLRKTTDFFVQAVEHSGGGLEVLIHAFLSSEFDHV